MRMREVTTNLKISATQPIIDLNVYKANDKCNTAQHDCAIIVFILCPVQLRLYAKYTDVAHVTQDDSARTHAICETELDYNYYLLKKGKKDREVFYFLIATLVVPIISILFTAMIVRSLHKNIHVRIARKVNHQNLAGLVLTGIFVTFYIVGCDALAVYYSFIGKNELSDTHELKRSLNFLTTAVMLLYDGIVCLIPLTVLLYVCCRHLYKNTYNKNGAQTKCNQLLGSCCLGCCLHRLLKMSFTIIFGTRKHSSFWNDEKWANLRLVWIMTLSLVAPLFVISSHVTFILVSWLTDTAKASSVALICLAVLLYLFFMFRQCYMANAKVNPISIVAGLVFCHSTPFGSASSWCCPVLMSLAAMDSRCVPVHLKRMRYR